ncbi:hypothetical protein SAY87_000261 [Trapa incisa]|uniref:Uncharacterized protein n=1 Tax=Trapa incisa TaxID=236973 RepID=A0AAN7GGF2_9MYRT|nr:hypothetical protein SAY87_000261 [Trapa incisa]
MFYVSCGYVGQNHRSTSTSCHSLPFSSWAFLSTIFFGIILIFYVETIAEERYLAAAGACIVFMEIFYKMDFSLPGLLLCCLILEFGIYEATSVGRSRMTSFHKSDLSDSVLGDQVQMSPLPT